MSNGRQETGTPGSGAPQSGVDSVDVMSEGGQSATAQPQDASSVRVTSSALSQSVAPRPRDGAPFVPAALVTGANLAWRFLAIVAAVLVLGKVLVTFKAIVIPVAIALLFTVLLQPTHRVLTTKLHFPKALSAIVSLLGLTAILTGLITVAGREIVTGISELSDKAVSGVQELTNWAQGAPLNLDLTTVNAYWNDLLGSLQKYTGTIISGALSVTSTLGHLVTGLLIIVFCTIFFLMDGRRIWSWLIGLLPRHIRERSHQAGRRGLVTLSSYVRTQILVAFIDAVGIGLGAYFIGLPLALPMGVLVFLGSFIPFIGAIVTGAIAVLVALVVKGWIMALVMMIIVLGIQQLESHVLQPFLMGKAVSLHPVAVLLVVLGGSMLAGIPGALFAVPLVAVLNTVILYFHGHDKFPQLGFEDHIEMRPEGRRPLMVTAAARYVSDGGWDAMHDDQQEAGAVATLDKLWNKIPGVARTEMGPYVDPAPRQEGAKTAGGPGDRGGVTAAKGPSRRSKILKRIPKLGKKPSDPQD